MNEKKCFAVVDKISFFELFFNHALHWNKNPLQLIIPAVQHVSESSTTGKTSLQTHPEGGAGAVTAMQIKSSVQTAQPTADTEDTDQTQVTKESSCAVIKYCLLFLTASNNNVKSGP